MAGERRTTKLLQGEESVGYTTVWRDGTEWSRKHCDCVVREGQQYIAIDKNQSYTENLVEYNNGCEQEKHFSILLA
jgi:hypothetical protein